MNTKHLPGIYTQVPNLESVILGNTVTLKNYFGKNAENVIELNKSLGLDYKNMYEGERVVWYVSTKGTDLKKK